MAWRGSLTRIKEVLRHGLALDKKEPDKFDSAFIERFSEKAREYHVAIPLTIFLEGFRPLSTIAASLLTGLEPAAELFFPPGDYRRLIAFLERRENISRLVDSLSK